MPRCSGCRACKGTVTPAKVEQPVQTWDPLQPEKFTQTPALRGVRVVSSPPCLKSPETRLSAVPRLLTSFVGWRSRFARGVLSRWSSCCVSCGKTRHFRHSRHFRRRSCCWLFLSCMCCCSSSSSVGICRSRCHHQQTPQLSPPRSRLSLRFPRVFPHQTLLATARFPPSYGTLCRQQLPHQAPPAVPPEALRGRFPHYVRLAPG